MRYPRLIHRRLCLGLVAALGLTLPTPTLFAQSIATGVVKERMARMKTMKESVRTLAPIAKGRAPLDPNEIRWAAGELLTATQGLTATFPENSIHGPSEARPTIWQSWDRFVEQSDQLEEAAAQMLASADAINANEFRRQFKAVAATCRSCHDDYRQKK